MDFAVRQEWDARQRMAPLPCASLFHARQTKQKKKKKQQHAGKASRRATTAPGMLPVGQPPRP
jgi:hypothetical protein